MQKAGDDFTRQVGRGQRGSQRLSETVEKHVGRLITQRQQDFEPIVANTRPGCDSQLQPVLHLRR